MITAFDWGKILVNINKLKWSGGIADDWSLWTICGVDGAFKSYAEKVIPKHDFTYWITTESMGYDVVRSYEWLILSETTSWSAQEDVDELFL